MISFVTIHYQTRPTKIQSCTTVHKFICYYADNACVIGKKVNMWFLYASFFGIKHSKPSECLNVNEYRRQESAVIELIVFHLPPTVILVPRHGNNIDEGW